MKKRKEDPMVHGTAIAALPALMRWGKGSWFIITALDEEKPWFRVQRADKAGSSSRFVLPNTVHQTSRKRIFTLL